MKRPWRRDKGGSYPREGELLEQADEPNLGGHGPRATASSAPSVVPERWRGRRRARAERQSFLVL
eukprot:6191761-Pleurochrysis_carterae.AAC.2